MGAENSAPHDAAALRDELCVAMGTMGMQDQIRQQVTSASSQRLSAEVHVITAAAHIYKMPLEARSVTPYFTFSTPAMLFCPAVLPVHTQIDKITEELIGLTF